MRRSLRRSLRTADWLAEIQQFLLVALVLVTTAGAVGLVAGAVGAPVDVELPGRSVLPAGTELRDGLQAAPGGMVTVRVDDPDAAQVALGLLTRIPVWAVTVAMLFLLWRLVRAARRTDPFTEPVARRLRRLGWVLVVGGPLAELVAFCAAFALAGTVDDPAGTLTLTPLLVWMLVGFGMLAVGEVVRRGLALRAELDTVV